MAKSKRVVKIIFDPSSRAGREQFKLERSKLRLSRFGLERSARVLLRYADELGTKDVVIGLTESPAKVSAGAKTFPLPSGRTIGRFLVTTAVKDGDSQIVVVPVRVSRGREVRIGYELRSLARRVEAAGLHVDILGDSEDLLKRENVTFIPEVTAGPIGPKKPPRPKPGTEPSSK